MKVEDRHMQEAGKLRYALAPFFSLNNQPDMSGDPTRRLSHMQLRRLDDAVMAVQDVYATALAEAEARGAEMANEALQIAIGSMDNPDCGRNHRIAIGTARRAMRARSKP
jgi:hypothetical protein